MERVNPSASERLSAVAHRWWIAIRICSGSVEIEVTLETGMRFGSPLGDLVPMR
jgi:hypothetical protein